MKPYALLPAGLLVLGMTAAYESGGTRRRALPPDSTRYRVAVAMSGYTGLAESTDCNRIANQQGYDSLIGIVGGIEQPPQADEDMEYEGTVERHTHIDYCMTNSLNQWCVDTLIGTARMVLHLTVYGEQGRGAWLKAEPVPGPPTSVSVRGNCDPSEIIAIKKDYPSGESGGSPDGQPVAESPPRPMFANHLGRLRDSAFYPARPPVTSWSLRVLRKLP